MKKNFYESDFFRKSRFKWDFLNNIEEKEKWHILSEKFLKNEKRNKAPLSVKKDIKIPKVIHQVWIGPRKMPNKYSLWRKSWIEKNSSWKYKLWTEEELRTLSFKNQNLFDQSSNIGFKSDIARYEILNLYGGVYLDTDFECIRPIPENLLNYDFVSCIVFSNKPQIANGFIMSAPGSKLIKNLIAGISIHTKDSDPLNIIKNSGAYNLTDKYFKLSDKDKENCLILPSNFFYPFPNFLLSQSQEAKNFITEDTIGIHYWEMSWIKGSVLKRIFTKIKNIFKKIFY